MYKTWAPGGEKCGEELAAPAILPVSLGLKRNCLFLFFKHAGFIPAAAGHSCSFCLDLSMAGSFSSLRPQLRCHLLKEGFPRPPNAKRPALTSHYPLSPPFSIPSHQHLNQSYFCSYLQCLCSIRNP